MKAIHIILNLSIAVFTLLFIAVFYDLIANYTDLRESASFYTIAIGIGIAPITTVIAIKAIVLKYAP